MPELPEVETIKLGLEKRIVGLKLTKIQIISPKSFIGNPNLLEGQKVLKVWRRAKILGIDLGKVTGNSGQVTVLIHLKMSGQLIWENTQRFIGGHPTPDMKDEMPNSHTRVIFTFENPGLPTLATSHLYFNDQRRFGWVRVVDRQQVLGNSMFAKLGPEPLEKEFTWKILKQNLLKHKNMPVKVAIMDQNVVAGIGNIYANEACFNAGIDPRSKVNGLTDKDMKSLHRGVLKALKDGIKHGGSSRAHFVDPEGKKGYFLDYAKVYWKDKRPCPVCKKEIKKIQIGGRGTYFCPNCQR